MTLTHRKNNSSQNTDGNRTRKPDLHWGTLQQNAFASGRHSFLPDNRPISLQKCNVNKIFHRHIPQPFDNNCYSHTDNGSRIQYHLQLVIFQWEISIVAKNLPCTCLTTARIKKVITSFHSFKKTNKITIIHQQPIVTTWQR